MPLQKIVSIIVLLILEMTRFWAFNARRKLPVVWGEGWFLGLQVPAEFHKGVGAELLRRYRVQTAIPYIVEFVLLAPIFIFASYIFILPAVVITSIMIVVWSHRVAKSFIKQAKPYAIHQPEASTVPMALSLTQRRFSDYTNVGVESAVIILTLAGLGVFVRYYNFFNWDGIHTFSAFLPLMLYFYLQMGALLLKQSLVRWRLALPGEQTDQYFKLFEERRSVLIRLFDYCRIVCAFVLLYALFDQVAADYLHWPRARLFHLVIGFSTMGALLIILRWYMHRMKKIITQIDLTGLVKMQRRLADKPTHFGGFAYFDSDNPSAVVRTTGGFVLNFANKRVYLCGVYFIGLITLITMLYKF